MRYNNEPSEFCKYKVSGDNFFTAINDYGSGSIYEKHSMQYCPKCGKKLPEICESVAVIIPIPIKPFAKAKKQLNLASA